MNTAIWGKTIIEQLLLQGVDYFCISPGSRSTPLAVALAENKKATTFIHYDERGSGFHALGYAKATGKPAAVIVTSGTALGNLMPAVQEASLSRTPLILLTADRPHELRDVLANQTCDQIKIFGDFVRYFFDLPVASPSLPSNFLGTTIGQLVHRSLFPLQGPVQLNCPFAEPLSEKVATQSIPIPPTIYSIPHLALSDQDCDKWVKKLESIEKGVIVLGAHPPREWKPLLALSEKLGWPILPDIISSLRSKPSDRTISYYTHILKAFPSLKADAILHFGDQVVSKPLLQWIGSHKGKPIIHVSNHSNRLDPLHLVTDNCVCEVTDFCAKIEPLISQKGSSWFDEWKEISHQIEEILIPYFDNKGLTEPKTVKIVEQMSQPGTGVFFANSMPIRDADMFYFPKKPTGSLFANRGLSGIDGNIATCAGIAETMPVVAVIGDQTFLHDLNSLSQLKKTRHPVTLIVINNGGGGIFSFVRPHCEDKVLESHFAAAHTMNFRSAAALFDIPYNFITSEKELAEVLQRKESCLIEVQTTRKENFEIHQEIDQLICSCFCTVS